METDIQDPVQDPVHIRSDYEPGTGMCGVRLEDDEEIVDGPQFATCDPCLDEWYADPRTYDGNGDGPDREQYEGDR